MLLDKSDVVFFVEEKDLFSRSESRLDYFSGPLFKDSLRSYQIVSQFDSDRSQGVLGSEVVVEESFVPEETRLSSQERVDLRSIVLFDVNDCEGGFFVQSDRLHVLGFPHPV